MHSDPGWIEDLLRCNQAPSDEAAQGVKELLVIPTKDLEDLDAEIFQLKGRLLEMENTRLEIQKRISRYMPILAPIRRVPPDVLAEIFYQCLPTDRNPIMKSNECPLLLTQVCSLWRAVAMSSPQLWERIHITFTDDDTLPDIESAAEIARLSDGENIDPGWLFAKSKSAKQETAEYLRRRYEAVKDWLLRSGTRPLSLSLCFTTSPWYAVPYSERPRSVGLELLLFLATLSPRWKEFEFKGPMQAYRTLENMLVVSEMTVLTSFIGEYDHQSPQSPNAALPLKTLGAPNLRNISMSGGNNNVWGFTDQTFVQWTKLTKITCLKALPLPAITFLLEHASNLVHYEGAILGHTSEDITVSEGPIYLPFLETLSITEYTNPHGLYNRIEAPRLRRVHYYSDSWMLSTDNDSLPSPPVLPLLRKSTELHELSVDAKDFMDWDLGPLLRAVPSSLTDLVLGDEETSSVTTGYFPSISVSMDYDSAGYLVINTWTIVADLIVKDFSSEDLEANHTLLPQLTSLIIAHPTIRVSDDIIFDLVKSRLVLSNGTATLEHAKVVFFKEKERDIFGELTQYAKDVGVKIDLDFEYGKPTPPNLNPTSPEFGLSAHSGQTV